MHSIKNGTSFPSLDNAAYFARMKRLNDTLWQWDVYNNKGPMIASQQMNNPETKTLAGKQMYYDSKGLLDSMGNLRNGRMDGEWYYLNDSVNIVTKKYFQMASCYLWRISPILALFISSPLILMKRNLIFPVDCRNGKGISSKT